MKFKLETKELIFFLLLFIMPIQPLYAYLDPGSGSYILQLLIAGIAGAVFSIKIFWKNIKMFIVSKFHKNKQDIPIEKNDDKK